MTRRVLFSLFASSPLIGWIRNAFTSKTISPVLPLGAALNSFPILDRDCKCHSLPMNRLMPDFPLTHSDLCDYRYKFKTELSRKPKESTS